MKVGNLIQTKDIVDIESRSDTIASGDIGFIKFVRDSNKDLPQYEVYFPWIQESFWLFQNEFEILS